ncbi:hypothetical protein NQ315_011999 [Exocentrus adspersus]|uniref:Transmembrane protein n=1 Tax=Exocentrus adspersus TaxID=1586481 RepID=A0AAV8W249_9CUCU|nr:hypothetical protein NQ315_011999 [Exocentrus adspersus]
MLLQVPDVVASSQGSESIETSSKFFMVDFNDMNYFQKSFSFVTWVFIQNLFMLVSYFDMFNFKAEPLGDDSVLAPLPAKDDTHLSFPGIMPTSFSSSVFEQMPFPFLGGEL